MPSTWIMSHGTAALPHGSVPSSGSHANGDHASPAPPAVRVRGVRRSFDAEAAPVRALRGLDLDIAAGEFVALMGPSGCSPASW
jgi:putative ABC transport system ATP-binding protein